VGNAFKGYFRLFFWCENISGFWVFGGGKFAARLCARKCHNRYITAKSAPMVGAGSGKLSTIFLAGWAGFKDSEEGKVVLWVCGG
jgi:hypothetical protein